MTQTQQCLLHKGKCPCMRGLRDDLLMAALVTLDALVVADTQCMVHSSRDASNVPWVDEHRSWKTHGSAREF